MKLSDCLDSNLAAIVAFVRPASLKGTPLDSAVPSPAHPEAQLTSPLPYRNMMSSSSMSSKFSIPMALTYYRIREKHAKRILLLAVRQEWLISILFHAPLGLHNPGLLIKYSTAPPMLRSIEACLRKHIPCANDNGTPIRQNFKPSRLC